jgi:hypothetical protein
VDVAAVDEQLAALVGVVAQLEHAVCAHGAISVEPVCAVATVSARVGVVTSCGTKSSPV